MPSCEWDMSLFLSVILHPPSTKSFFHNLSRSPSVCFALPLGSSLPHSACESKLNWLYQRFITTKRIPVTVCVQNSNRLLKVTVWEEKHMKHCRLTREQCLFVISVTCAVKQRCCMLFLLNLDSVSLRSWTRQRKISFFFLSVSWCSGLHICRTSNSSPVQSWKQTGMPLVLL